MKLKSIIFSMLIAFSGICLAQKIKYKDLYPVLAEKQYEVGIPKLFEYLAIEENQSEANPNLQMGLWLEDKFMKLEDTNSDRLTQIGDSAIFFLTKAKSLIDEKEVKKGKEYYKEFIRRDLRSGKFLIKVSDVHLDIENRVSAIENRMNSK